MKRKYIIIPLTLLLLTSVFSCKKYLDINKDPNNPSEVTEQLMTPAVISTFAFEIAGGYPVRITSLWTKHLAYGGSGPHEGNYQLTANDVDNFWRYFSYNSIMGTAKELIAKGDKNGNPSFSAIGRIMLAWNLGYLTDCYGSIPYSNAFMGAEGVVKPTYDSQEEIFKQMQILLDQAIIDAGKGTGVQPEAEDFLYGGKMSSWIALANTLKARYYLRLSNAPGYSSATQANLALTALNAGAITDATAPKFVYLNQTNADNPWYQYAVDGKWNTANRPSQYYVDLLQNSKDPRLPFQVEIIPALSATDPGANFGKFVGITNDPPPLALVNYSAIGSFYSAKDAKLNMLISSEVQFIRAEAEFLKAGKVVNQQTIAAYEAGVASSMKLYGITNYADYLTANKLTLGMASADAYKLIMTQKYIANYLQLEAYNDFRRTGYPELPINDDAYPGETVDVEPVIDIIPLRFPYPSSERSYNAANIPGDVPIDPLKAMKVPLWWDK